MSDYCFHVGYLCNDFSCQKHCFIEHLGDYSMWILLIVGDVETNRNITIIIIAIRINLPSMKVVKKEALFNKQL